MSAAGDVCETFEFVDVPITSGVTTYTAYVTDTVLHATVAFPGVYSTSPPYSDDHILFDGATFNAPAGRHQIPLAEVGAHGGCASEAGRFGLIKVLGTTSCAASSGAALVKPQAVAQVAAAGSSCDLDVTVTGKKSLTAGLAFDGLGPTFLEQDGCLSGCTDLLVTVRDPGNHDRVVAGANVSASVTPIGDKFLTRASTGYLCNAAKPTSCGVGRFITGLKTDRKGHVRLRYWAPGLLSKQATTLTVKAMKSCSKSACSRGEKLGETNPTIRVSPNLIYQHDATLTLEEARTLADWSQGTFLPFARNKAIEFLFDHALDKLVEAEKVAEHLGEKLATGLERIAGVLEIVHIAEGILDQYKAMALFLNDFKLSAVGLGEVPEERVVSAAPSEPFTRALAGDGLPPLHLGAKGLLWRYGEQLAFLDEQRQLHAQFIHLLVYEVSDCKQGAECGPGYHGQHGIRPRLYVEFVAMRSRLEGSYRDAFDLRYNARAWMHTQQGLAPR
jgi:hypothetical protein